MSLAHGSMCLTHFDRFWDVFGGPKWLQNHQKSIPEGVRKRSRNRWLPRWPNDRFLVDFGSVLGSKKRGFDMYFTVFRRLRPFCKGNPFQNRFLMILEPFGTSKNVPKSIKMGEGHWQTAASIARPFPEVQNDAQKIDRGHLTRARLLLGIVIPGPGAPGKGGGM